MDAFANCLSPIHRINSILFETLLYCRLAHHRFNPGNFRLISHNARNYSRGGNTFVPQSTDSEIGSKLTFSENSLVRHLLSSTPPDLQSQFCIVEAEATMYRGSCLPLGFPPLFYPPVFKEFELPSPGECVRHKRCFCDRERSSTRSNAHARACRRCSLAAALRGKHPLLSLATSLFGFRVCV